MLSPSKGFAFLFIAVLLSGCPVESESLPGARPPTRYFGLVLNRGDASIGSYEIDPDTGVWTATGPNINTLSDPIMMRLSQDGTLALVLTDNGNMPRLTSYSVNNNTGSLVQTYRRGTGLTPMDVAVTPDKRFVYVANYNPSSIYIYERNPSTNNIVELGVEPIADKARRLSMSPDGRFLFVSRGDLNTPGGGVSAYTIDPDTGDLGFAMSDTAGNVNAMSVAVDPASEKLCRLDTNMNSGVQGYHLLVCRSISAAGVPIGGEFADTPFYPYDLSFDRSGRFIFVVHKSSNKLVAYARGSTGTLIPDIVNEQDTQTDPSWVATDPRRDFVYVANTGSDSISVYSMNPDNGAAGHQTDIDTGSQPIVVEVVASD